MRGARILKAVLRIILLPLFILGLPFSKTRRKCWHIVRKNILKSLIFYIVAIVSFSLAGSINKEKYEYVSDLSEDPSFELGTWREIVDCCKSHPGKAQISATLSKDSYHGKYSLKLKSSNHCACVSIPTDSLSLERNYKISFNYKNIKGDNPYFCLWDEGCKKCTVREILPKSKNWELYENTFKMLNCSKRLLPHFYSMSNGSVTTINLYDNVKIQEIIR